MPLHQESHEGEIGRTLPTTPGGKFLDNAFATEPTATPDDDPIVLDDDQAQRALCVQMAAQAMRGAPDGTNLNGNALLDLACFIYVGIPDPLSAGKGQSVSYEVFDEWPPNKTLNLDEVRTLATRFLARFPK